MSERYANIEDESFPSFLAESINSNFGDALENCTLTSNLGLPVAASTIAKSRTASERLPDVHASYLENEKRRVSSNHFSRHSGGEENGKFALSFKDELEDVQTFIGTVKANNQIKASRLSDMTLKDEFLQSGLKNDFSSGLGRTSQSSSNDKLYGLPTVEDIKNQMQDLPVDLMGSSVESFLENEKLMSIASLDGSSSDEEINDEEFCDEELEAYFKNLQPPGMQRGVVEGQEILEPKRTSIVGVNNFLKSTKIQENNHLQNNDDLEEDFQMLQVRLAATGMDSAPCSDEDAELELEKVALQPLQRDLFLDNTGRHLIGEQNRPSFRPGLEGGSSEEDSSSDVLPVHSNGAASSYRQSAEGYGICSPRPTMGAVEDTFGHGDGSSGSEESLKIPNMKNTRTSGPWTKDLPVRSVAGEERMVLQSKDSMARIAPVGNGSSTKADNAPTIDQDRSHTFDHGATGLDFYQPSATHGLDSLYFQEQNSLNYQADSESRAHLSQIQPCNLGNMDSIGLPSSAVSGLADEYLSPTYSQHEKNASVSSDLWQPSQSQAFQFSFPEGGDEKGDGPHHSVVYQNEEGKWVTDLAYYRPFDNEHTVSFSADANDQFNGDDFVVGSDALAMLDEDQEEFEKEHQFIQDEKMDLENLSNLGDTSWKVPTNANVLLKSQMSSDLPEDASYLRLSFGEFFSQRSEALGCLGGGMDVKRPSFGYHIISPEKQEPVRLLRQSDMSEHDDTIKFCDDTLTPEDLGCLPDDQKLASATFDVRAPGEKYTEQHVGKQQRENSNMEDQSMTKETTPDPKSNQTANMTLLNISTIASAIANASCSADPQQLAAMILALSNKNRLGNGPHDASISKLLQASLRSSGFENFVDMEKYLKPTFNNSQASDHEGYEHSVKDFSLDFSVGFKPPPTDSTQDLANITDVQKQDLRNPETSREVHVGCVKPLPVGKTSGASLECGALSNGNVRTSLSRSSDTPFNRPNANIGAVNLENKKIPSAPVTPEIATVRSNADSKVDGIASQKEREPLRPCLHDSAKSKSPRKSSSCMSSKSAIIKPNNDREEVAHKHVSFQPSLSVMQQNLNENKAFSEYAVHSVDDEQYSFRPSTCPLIHSSPSQDSLKFSENCESPPKQKCSYDSSSESSCLSASLSRLTYVSALENTLQNSTALSPEKKKGNNTIELSTTIVRASPTPSEMQLAASDNFSWEAKNQKAKQRSPSGFKAVSSTGATYKAGDTLTDAKMELQPSSLITKEPVPFPWQDYTTKYGKELLSANILQSATMQNIPGSQCACVPGLKPVLSSCDAHILPSSIPTLLTGQSLSNTPFAQQYLGSQNTLPAYPGVNSVMGYSSCTLPSQNIQNKVAGVPLNLNMAPGLLAQLPMSNPATCGQSLEHFHMLEKQPSTVGLSQWTSSRLSSGFEQVVVPEEVTFSGACCVGIASETTLKVFNPNERWMQVNIGVLSIGINGEKVDPGAHQCLVFKNKSIIGPRVAEDIKILFLPQRPGLFQCILNVSSWPVSADTETIVRAETMASKVLLVTVSEYPVIEVDAGKSNCIDFGDLSSGNWKTLPLKLVNRSRATVPIRLTISANATAWRCFTFSKDPTNLVNEFAVHADPHSKMSSPSVISHVMHASHDGQDPESWVLWIVFHAPQMYNSAGSLGPPEEFVARVDIEIDSPGPAYLLKSVPLHARAGCVRIHAPKDLQTIHLTCSVGSTAKQMLPLKNAGNISAHLKIKCTNEEGFSVDPEDVFLKSGEEQVVAVQFSPAYTKSKQSILKIMVQPSGPEYDVTLVGEAELPVGKNPVPKGCPDVPPILSNKQFMSWGGVAVGRAVQQKLTLRNTSGTIGQHLRLIIRGQDQDCFQFLSMFGPEERLTSSRELTLRPKEDATVLLMFSPTCVGCMLAKLEIKHSGSRPSQPGIKFTIPLAGYGGTSNIILEDLKKLSDSYLLTLSAPTSGRISKASFSVKNTGSRAAYVKAACLADLDKGVVMDPKLLCITPDKFVLKQGSQQIVTVSYIASSSEQYLQSNNLLLCMVCFFYGDEVSRQQFRRAVLHKPEMANKVIAEYSKLKNARFDEEFPGEQLISEGYDLPQRPNDIQLFFGNMRKIVLSVVESKNNTVGLFVQSSGSSLDSSLENAGRSVSNASLDVLPVKGPQGPPLSNGSVPSRISGRPEYTWTVQPECLLLGAPTADDIAETGQIQIYNHCSRLLEFDLSWPAHCLTVTPQHGSIEPQRHKLILVSPNPTLSAKQTSLPWNGQIYLHCDNEQKIVKVQIHGGARSGSENAGKKIHPVLTPRLDTPVHVAKPLPKTPASVMEIKNRTIVFPTTAAGSTSESFLEMENPSDEDVQWFLSSFAPPYVKGVDQTDDIYRVTYTAFRCLQMSGLLSAHNRLKVPISFFPSDQGDYTQFWDIECHPVSEPSIKHNIRFQLCGEGYKGETKLVRRSMGSVVKEEVPVMPRRRCGSEASACKPGQAAAVGGVYAAEEVYTFPPTFVGESSTLKVSLKNNSFSTYMLKFVSPKDPFQVKHSKYALRAHHFINLPVKFKPSTTGRFEDSLVVQTDAENICIQLVGEALVKR